MTIGRVLGGVAVAGLLGIAGPAGAGRVADAAAARAIRAGVPADQVGAIVRRGAERRAGDPAVAAGLGEVTSAARAGLPTGPVADKVLEGLAKGVPGPRLAPAAREVTARLGAAKNALGELAARPRAVEEAAEALRRGATPETLGAFASSAHGAAPGLVGPALRELGELADRGAGSPAAGDALGRLAARGYPLAAIDSISGQLDELLEEGGAPAELLSEVAARAAAGRPVERLVDPFAERPSVIRDRGAARGVEAGAPSAAGVSASAPAPLPAATPGPGSPAPALDRGKSGAAGAVSPLDRTPAGSAAEPVDEDPVKRGKRRGHDKKR